WLYGTAQIMMIFEPVRATLQSLVNRCFAHNVLAIWFTPLGLAAVYYFIPKVLGKPIHSYYLSILAFWTLALFYNWAGVHHLIGGPVPAWVISAGVVASVMMVIPVLITALNHHVTMVGSFGMLQWSPVLRFSVFAAMSYTAVSLQGSMMALRSVNEITSFTHFTVGHSHWGMYAWFTMAMFGALYYILPRLLKREWPSATLIRVHFWTVALGVGTMIVALTIAGWFQGLNMVNPDRVSDFGEITKATIPWLVVRSISGVMILIGHVAFVINVALILAAKPAKESAPTLFSDTSDQLGKEGAHS
ncbi:MAG: cbb3-type cytochrome c oxidase subunit I, partial [Opitutales bacterium]|nr:cbb3-type cytochrome c oxidase subunit I [Opitutales bacterium]